jgi:hypothetical protein
MQIFPEELLSDTPRQLDRASCVSVWDDKQMLKGIVNFGYKFQIYPDMFWQLLAETRRSKFGMYNKNLQCPWAFVCHLTSVIHIWQNVLGMRKQFSVQFWQSNWCMMLHPSQLRQRADTVFKIIIIRLLKMLYLMYMIRKSYFNNISTLIAAPFHVHHSRYKKIKILITERYTQINEQHRYPYFHNVRYQNTIQYPRKHFTSQESTFP